MDPASIVGLLGAICNLIEANNQLIQAIKTVKNTEKDLSELCHDVLIFAETLKGFDRVLRDDRNNHHISAAVLTKAVQDSSATIDKLRNELSPIVSSNWSFGRRIRWIQKKSKVRTLHGRVNAQSDMLHCLVKLAHVETYFNRLLQVHAPADEEPSNALGAPDVATLRETTSRVSTVSSTSSCASVGSAISSVEDTEPSSQQTESACSSNVIQCEEGDDISNPSLEQNVCRCNGDYRCRMSILSGQNSEPSQKIAVCKRRETSCVQDDANCKVEKIAVKDQFSRFLQKFSGQIGRVRNMKVRHEMSIRRMVPKNSGHLCHVKLRKLDSLVCAVLFGRAIVRNAVPDRRPLVHTAVCHRQLPIVRYMLEVGADAEVADVGARKPADLALMNSLTSGATQTERDIFDAFPQKDETLHAFGLSPIHIAVLGLYGKDDEERPSLKDILDFVDECNNAPPGTKWKKWRSKYKRRSPLFGKVTKYYQASASEQPKTFKVIHDLVNQKDRRLYWTPLHWACAAGKRNEIQTLIYYGADPAALSNLQANILHAGAESKTFRGLEDALKIWRRAPDQIDINQLNHWNETPLHIAAGSSAHNVELLVEAGADRSIQQKDGQTPLHYAGTTANGGRARKKIIDLLCAGNDSKSINTQDNEGRPPLFNFLDEASCVKMLVEHGASIELLDKSGRSAIHHACMTDYDETLELLLRLSTSSEPPLATVKDDDGNTALHLALSHESRNCALLLLGLEDVGDMVGQDGWSAVHHAAKRGDCDVLEAVLKHPNHVQGAKTGDGKTVETVAMEAGTWHGEIKNLLRSHNYTLR